MSVTIDGAPFIASDVGPRALTRTAIDLDEIRTMLRWDLCHLSDQGLHSEAQDITEILDVIDKTRVKWAGQ